MTWLLSERTKINPLNKSKYARRRGIKLWNRTLVPLANAYQVNWHEKKPRADMFLRYPSLRDFAVDVNDGWFEPFCFVQSPEGFQQILAGVLADIKTVVKTLMPRPEKGQVDTWPIPTPACLLAHFEDTASEINPRNFQKLSFYFCDGQKQRDPHFYQWEMRYNDPALVITEEVSFTKVTKVSDSVWMVDRADGKQVAIKFETCPQPLKAYERRYEYTQWLARRAFKGVPISALLTAKELEIVGKTKASEKDGPNFKPVLSRGEPPTLARIAWDTSKGTKDTEHYKFTKIKPVEVGKNLEKLIDEMDTGAMNSGELRAFFFVPAKLKEFGKIAVFDLIVANADRFPAETVAGKQPKKVKVGLKNIDFTLEGEPLALDNVDPYGQAFQLTVWPGKEHLENEDKQREYARMVLADFLRVTGSVEYYLDGDVEGYTRAFYDGMREGVQTLQGLRLYLQKKVDEDKDDYGKMFGTLIDTRIGSMS